MNNKDYLKYKINDLLLFSQISFCKNRKPYEKFLLDIVNESNYFLRKSHNEKYISPSCESNGEHDCISQSYKLDFKLLISKSYMEGKSISSKHYIYLTKGVRFDQYPTKVPQRKNVGLIHKQLSQSYTCKQKSDVVDIKSIEKCLNKQKNLLLFLPYEFSFEDDKNSFNENNINKILTEDLIVKLARFREKCMNKYDTYLVYIFDESAIINIINENEIRFVEKISLKENEIYNLVCCKN